MEKASIEIGVDDSVFIMKFESSMNIEPDIQPTDDGYSLWFRNIYKNIDIHYSLESDKIKENIIIKSKNSENSFDVSFSLKNCVLFFDSKDKKYKILGPDQGELFRFDEPKVIYEEHNKNIALSKAVKLKCSQDLGKITYLFDKDVMYGAYPVMIDPTFSFNTRIKHNFGNLRTGFDQHNAMFITGKTFGDFFVREAEKNTVIGGGTSYNPELAYYVSDDVVFERDIRIIFPFTASVIDSAIVTIGQGSNKITKSFYNIPEKIIDRRIFKYIDISIPAVPGDINVDCVVKLIPSVYGDFSIAFSRRLTYLPKIDYSFSSSDSILTSYIDLSDNNSIMNVSNIMVGLIQSFKPLSFHIIPYKMIPIERVIETFSGLTLEMVNQNDQYDTSKINEFSRKCLLGSRDPFQLDHEIKVGDILSISSNEDNWSCSYAKIQYIAQDTSVLPNISYVVYYEDLENIQPDLLNVTGNVIFYDSWVFDKTQTFRSSSISIENQSPMFFRAYFDFQPSVMPVPEYRTISYSSS